MINGKVAMMMHGRLDAGRALVQGLQGLRLAAAPGNDGIYQMLSDSFGLPKDVKNRDAALNWLKVCGSKDGQDGFNPPKGSIPARTDADMSASTPTTTSGP